MYANVKITARRGSEVVDYREGHNVWVDDGRGYLARTTCFTSPQLSTTEGSVHLVAAFPVLTNERLFLRLGYYGGSIEYEAVLSSPVDSTDLLTQLNAQTPGLVASLGANFGLVFTAAYATSLEIVSGSAIIKLGLFPEYVPPAGMTTTPVETRRIKYMAFGIGGTKQNSATVNAAPLSTSYPAGADPNVTAGNEYNSAFPTTPLITSLERPVRVTGGTNPYPGDPGDAWLVQSPKFTSYVVGTETILFIGDIDGNNEVTYGPYTQMPLSEVGLFLDDSDPENAFNAGKLVAYHSFGTITLTPGIQLELIWTVSFS